MASSAVLALAVGAPAEAEGAEVGALELAGGDADGLGDGFDGPQAETIRTAIRTSEAIAGRRPRRGSVRWDMGRIVAWASIQASQRMVCRGRRWY
jgi:hypothetical protein